MTRELRGSYVEIWGGGFPSRHRPTAREAPKGPTDQPRTKVFWGAVIEANGTGVTRSRPLNQTARGLVQRLCSGGRGSNPAEI